MDRLTADFGDVLKFNVWVIADDELYDIVDGGVSISSMFVAITYPYDVEYE